MPIYDVIIIGAGLSGLAAADQLAQNQRSFIMLEAREQPGGRVRTIFNEYCHPVELGAEFIHGRPPEIFDLIAEGRLRVIDGSESHMSVEAGRRKEVRGSDDFFAPEEQLLAAMHAHADGEDTNFSLFASRLAASRPELKAAIIPARDYIEGYNASDADTVSITWLSLCDKAARAISGNDIFHFVNGYSTVTTALIARVGKGNILLQSPVQQIDWKPGSVVVRTAGGLEYFGRTALVTLPIGVLQARGDQENCVVFSPELPKGKTGLEKIIPGQAIRLVLQFKSRFWETHTLADGVRLDRLNFLHSPSTEFSVFWTQYPVRTPLIVAWIGGKSTRGKLDLPVGTLTELALQSLSTGLGIDMQLLQDQLETAHYHNWHTDPYARGVYSYVAEGGMAAPKELAKPLEDTLFFAGEATDYEGHSATVHGAIRTGIRAAGEMLAALSLAEQR